MEMVKLADDAQCPGCGGKLDGATPIQPGSVPKPGDFSICTNCGAMLEFEDAQGHVRHMAASVFKALPLEMRKKLAYAQSEVLKALKGGRL